MNGSESSIAQAPAPRALVPGAGAISDALERRFEAERDQLALWLPVALIAGISAWFWLPGQSGWAGWLALCLGISVAALGFAGGKRWGRAVGIFALAAALGCGLIWWKADRVAAPRLERAAMMNFVGRVESVQPMAAEARIRLVVAPEGTGLPARLRVNVDEDKAPAGIEVGARIRVRAWMMPPPHAAAPGGYDFARAAWFQRLGGTGRASEIAIVQLAAERSWRALLSDWRNRLSAHIRGSLGSGAEGAIAAALATGDQYGLSEADAEAMRRSGLAHLLSVSGLHLTAVVGAVMLICLKLLALSPSLALRLRLVLIAAAAGALAGVGYTLLTGAEVPTVRACIAALLVLAGIAMGRDALTLRLVATGALVILLLWPESVAGASFQFSFAAMVAIVALHEHPRIRALLSRRDESFFARVGRILIGLLLTGLAVELALAPIALFHFHKSGLYGAAANVIAIPLTTFVIMPLEGMALLFDLVGLGAPFWWLTGKGLGALLWLARTAASAPGAVALMPAMPRGAFAMIVAGGLWICLWRTGWRRFGWVGVAIGAVWALATPAPDLIVTGDGKHLVLRGTNGDLFILRPRAGDYVRSTLAELAGEESEFRDLESLPAASCSPDLCAVDVDRGGRRWRLLVTRTVHFVRWDQMVRACGEADIVVADRRLPDACRPRWLRADRTMLRRSGGLSIFLGDSPRIATAAEQSVGHPWAR